jgi:hypothetical protein
LNAVWSDRQLAPYQLIGRIGVTKETRLVIREHFAAKSAKRWPPMRCGLRSGD